MKKISGTFVSREIMGREIRFFINNSSDAIQKNHHEGNFYESDELSILSEFFPKGGVYVDIGANVGNHLIYVCKYLFPSAVIAFEPNPRAIELLRINISLNNLSSVVDSSFLGLGLSKRSLTASVFERHSNNLGGAVLQPNEGGDIRLVAGDSLIKDRRVDFLKIDVEGMELDVLEGLSISISNWRPAMFIEIDNVNYNLFSQWLLKNSYIIKKKFKRYEANENFMILPIEKDCQIS